MGLITKKFGSYHSKKIVLGLKNVDLLHVQPAVCPAQVLLELCVGVGE